MNQTKCPLPTPELAASLANQYIEELFGDWNGDVWGAMSVAFVKVVGNIATDQDERTKTLCQAALRLARDLNHPTPYETQVTLLDGTKQLPERHTITHFVDGQGFSNADWAAIAALEVGESYVIAGNSAVMTVTRIEQ